MQTLLRFLLMKDPEEALAWWLEDSIRCSLHSSRHPVLGKKGLPSGLVHKLHLLLYLGIQIFLVSAKKLSKDIFFPKKRSSDSGDLGRFLSKSPLGCFHSLAV
jgi:hypothetical protein